MRHYIETGRRATISITVVGKLTGIDAIINSMQNGKELSFDDYKLMLKDSKAYITQLDIDRDLEPVEFDWLPPKKKKRKRK